jgi:hypothetical protein
MDPNIVSIDTNARIDCITWKIQSLYGKETHLQFYSQKYDFVWPVGGQVYVLDDFNVHTIQTCTYADDTVCYGAWRADNPGYFWGVGKNNQYWCNGYECCYEAEYVETSIFTLMPW